MLRRLRRWKAPLFAVPLVLLLLCFCGCEDKKPEVSEGPARMQDAQYLKQLDEVRAGMKSVARTSNSVKAEMCKVIAQARANLPKDATDEQIKAELENHPEKYPAWKELVAKNGSVNAEIEKKAEDAQKIVRARILKELAEQKTAPKK